MSLRAYLNKLRLRDSAILLTETDLPVTEVALDSGFNDTSYFIYLFKKEFGVSPLKYRKEKYSEKILDKQKCGEYNTFS